MSNWDTIIARDGPLVWQTLWRLLGNRADVEECFQETFVSAIKLARKQSIASWPAALCTLATARAMDRLRSRYRRQGSPGRHQSAGLAAVSFDQTELIDQDAGPVEQAVASELSERLRQALAQLPDRQAEIFYLHALCGWNYREIGERWQMTENAIGVTVHRARQRLRELLRDVQ